MSYYQTIYDLLRAAGMTEAGALGVLGNWQEESGCEPNRKQGDFSPYRTASKEYTEGVMNGSIPKTQFANGYVGYGLAQWTLQSRQSELFDFWKASGKRLDDVTMQVDFAIKEFKRDFIPDWRLLCSTNDIYEATKAVCYRFENPQIKNVDPRFRSAKRIQEQIDLDPHPVPPEPPSPPEPPDPPLEIFWPPRMIDWNCYDFPEVMVLTSVLYCRGYLESTISYWDGKYGTVTKAVEEFQTDNGLTTDGCVGPMTWRALLEMWGDSDADSSTFI